MNKATVIQLRNYFEKSGIRIVTDNMLTYENNLDHSHLVWDDENETVYQFRPNNSHYEQTKKRIKIEATNYDNIQHITSTTSREELVEMLDKMKAVNLVDTETYSNILKSYDTLNNKLL